MPKTFSEMDYFLMIMTNLARAKTNRDIEVVEEAIDDLRGMAIHGAKVFALRAAAEADRAVAWIKAAVEGSNFPPLAVDNVTPMRPPAPLN